MAGIGFALRKLTKRDDILGVVQSYAFSSFVSSGPWLFTIFALSGINVFAGLFVSLEEIALFRVVVIYNFAFSLVLTGPILFVLTRYLADRIFLKDVSEAVGAMMGSLLLALILALGVAAPFYLLVAEVSQEIKLLGVLNFLLISGIWMANVFVSAMKDYTAVAKAFGFGMTIAGGFAVLGSNYWGVPGMLAGFNLGMMVLLFTLIARVFTEYPYFVTRPLGFCTYFTKFSGLALVGLTSSVALWIDKWIMWRAPESEILSGFIFYSDYDSAMFLAFLTTVPSLALFIVSVETRFFLNYQKFYKDMQEHCSLAKIENNHKRIMSDILGSLRNLLILQGAISAIAIISAPKIFDALGINYLQLGIFRFGVLGAYFLMIIQFLSIFLAYFDLRKELLVVNLALLVSSAVFTYLSLGLGHAYYGSGFAVATVLTLLVAYFLIYRNVPRLPYLTFIQNNPSIEK